MNHTECSQWFSSNESLSLLDKRDKLSPTYEETVTHFLIKILIPLDPFLRLFLVSFVLLRGRK